MKSPVLTRRLLVLASFVVISHVAQVTAQTEHYAALSWSDLIDSDYLSYTEANEADETIGNTEEQEVHTEESTEPSALGNEPIINLTSEEEKHKPESIEGTEFSANQETNKDIKQETRNERDSQDRNILIDKLSIARNAEPHPKVNVISKINKYRKPQIVNEIKETTTQKSYRKYDENTGVLIGDAHPCDRECKLGEPAMICYYHFQIEWYQTMSKACYDCPYNQSDCFRSDCIPADGVNRPITVINRKMPGPAIEVCQNDRIIVDVVNDLMVEGTTIHWHGQHQRGTPYMDGTPYVTQCPILPESTFRYQFNATHAGTHFWHSHAGMQRADGAAGALVIRKPTQSDRHARLYDFDKSSHTMIVTDWVHELSISTFTHHHHSSGDNKPPTLLVNGLGRFEVFNETDRPLYMKSARFNVEKDYRYRFRVINAEFLNCPIELSVDGHNLTLVASDGYDIEPVTATSLVTYAGERFDFILEASAEIDNYWIRFRGLMDCDERFTKAKQVAVLHYEGALEQEPGGHLTWEQSHNEGLQINALNKGTEENETISIAELRSMDPDDDSLKEIADYQFYVSYDFYPKNNSHFHKSPYYGYYQVPDPQNRLYTPQLNHISMKLPSTPLLISRPPPESFCNSSSVGGDCKKEYCECHHVLSVKTGSVVEVILVDEGVTFDANHPFHLHGHSFRVVALRRLSANISIEAVKEYDKAGLLHRNLKNAPIKDTVTVPDGGYTVIRFKADNPGYWLFHCHIEFHAEVGMAMVFKVGENDEMAPIPPNFPTCGDFTPDNLLELATEAKPKDPGPHISINHFWPLVYVNSTSGVEVARPLSLLIAIGVWMMKLMN